MNLDIKPGTLLADKLVPGLTGLVIEVNHQYNQPFKILCEDQILRCDLDYILEHCDVISNTP